MTTPLSSSTSSLPQPAFTAPAARFNYAAVEHKAATITMRTEDGDLVTLSAEANEGFTAAGTMAEEAGTRGTSFTMAQLADTGMGFSVVGDLDQQELHDIAELVHDLRKVAKAFFNGDLDTALKKAADIDEMGSVVQLVASFQYRQGSSSQLSGFHPIPTADLSRPRLIGPLAQERVQATVDTPTINELLKGQWQQIEQLFAAGEGDGDDDHHRTNEKPGSAANNDGPPATLGELAASMEQRINKTIADHPRLAPLMVPTADKAFRKEAELLPEVARHKASTAIDQLMGRLNDWLFSSSAAV